MNRLLNLVTALVLSCSGVFAANPPGTPDDITRDLMRFSGNIHQFKRRSIWSLTILLTFRER